LAWVLAQRPWIVPIPGTTKLHRVEENIAAVEVGLTVDDLRKIDAALPEAQGERYSEANQRMIDRSRGFALRSVRRSSGASRLGPRAQRERREARGAGCSEPSQNA